MNINETLSVVRASATLDVDLSVFSRNIASIQSAIGQSRICLVVKSNAYGLGMTEIAKEAVRLGVSFLAVARIEEAKCLRMAGIQSSILLLSEVHNDQIPHLFEYRITPTVYSDAFIDALDEMSSRTHRVCPVHLKVDTGMRRLGCELEEFSDRLSQISSKKHLLLEGVYSHFTQSSDRSEFTQSQVKRFEEMLSLCPKDKPLLTHLANSGAIDNVPASYFRMVRVGLAAYDGVSKFKTEVMYIKRVAKGASVGYERAYIANKDEYIAILPVGYSDGVSTALSNKGKVLIRGKSYPIVGKVCMDLTIVGLGETLGSVSLGDEVVLLGQQGNQEITLQDISQLSGLNPREFLCGIGNRVSRVYSRPC